MKKAITILAVLIVLVGAVFADDGAKETHSIRLVTDVADQVPAFQLTYVSGAKANTTLNSSTTNGTPNVYNSAAVADPDYKGNDIEVADISSNDIEVVFNVVLANAAKLVQDYQLTLKAGPFNVRKDGDPAIVKPASAVITDIAPAARLGVETKAAYNVDAATNGNTGEKSQSFGLHFNGTTCATGALATYTVGYTADPAVDPNTHDPQDPSTWYYANIALEIVSK